MLGPRQRAERIDLNLQLAQAYAFSGDLERALEILVQTEHLATSLGDEERLGKIFHRSAQIFWLRGQPETAGDYARRALRSAEELNDRPLLQAALRMLGRVGIAISAFDDAIAYLLRYLNLEKSPIKPPDLSVVLGYLGIAYARVGSWNRAVETARRGVNLAEAEASAHTILFARMQLGFVHADAHRWQTCLETLGQDGGLTAALLANPESPDAGRTAPATPLGYMFSALRGLALVHSGQAMEGVQLIRAALRWSEQNDYRVFHYLPRLFLADGLLLSKEYRAAQAEAELALEQAQAAGNRWAVGVTLRALAESLARQPSQNWTLIEDHLIHSMLTLRQIRARPDLARTYLAMRRLYDRAGQIAWAVDCHFRATSIFEELDMEEELLQAQGQAAGDRRGAVVISDMRLKGPNIGEEAC
jgi:tetratricopeptide (TPR) repeat protein